MAPFYQEYDPNHQLRTDDIRGIQAIYGEKVRHQIQETTTTSSIPQPEGDNTPLCQRNNLDTMVTTKDGDTYVFSGEIYWKLAGTKVAPGFPRSISSDWDGLPGSLDAAFTWINGKIFFFKGTKFWRFSSIGQMDVGFPKDISQFTGIPDNVDAAFVWPGNDLIYFFKGSQYWKFDPKSKPSVNPIFPRPISDWTGVPDNLDTVMQYSNGKSYFFKDGQYYRFDDISLSVDVTTSRPYPRQTAVWWFGCPQGGRLTRLGGHTRVTQGTSSSFN